MEREELEGSKAYDQSQIVQTATEFSNNKAIEATKNSNSEEKRRRERDLNLWALVGGSLIMLKFLLWKI